MKFRWRDNRFWNGAGDGGLGLGRRFRRFGCGGDERRWTFRPLHRWQKEHIEAQRPGLVKQPAFGRDAEQQPDVHAERQRQRQRQAADLFRVAGGDVHPVSATLSAARALR